MADKPPAAPGEDASCALALVNTRYLRAGEPADLLATDSQAAGWLAAQGLAPEDVRLTQSETARLRALRETIRALFTARARQSVPVPGEVASLNAAIAAAPVLPALNWDDTGPRRGQQVLAPDGRDAAPGPFGAAIARLAGDALHVLTAPEGPEPAPCAAHGCIRWFLRTHAARQWCSTRCGDRVRAARHYARHHSAADA